MVQLEIVPLVEEHVKLALPSRCSFDHEIHDRKIGAIFHAGWQSAGHADGVREPGDYLTARVAGEEIAVIRERDGALWTFFNVCRHRGHRLLAGKGRLKVAVENYGACYHCRYAHPTLLDLEEFVFENPERHLHQRTSGHPRGVTLHRVDAEAGDRAPDFASWLVWPNVVFRFHPDGPGRTIAHIDWFLGPWVEGGERDGIPRPHDFPGRHRHRRERPDRTEEQGLRSRGPDG